MRWKGGLSYIQNDLVVAGSPTWNAQVQRGVFTLACFERSNDPAAGWLRHDIKIEEAAYSDHVLSAALRQADFDRVHAIDASRDADLPNEEGRTFWVARV